MEEIIEQGRAMMVEQKARREALVQWMVSQEIPKIERLPFLALAIGHLLTLKRPGDMLSAAIGLTLLEEFLAVGAERALKEQANA